MRYLKFPYPNKSMRNHNMDCLYILLVYNSPLHKKLNKKEGDILFAFSIKATFSKVKKNMLNKSFI
ncbi:hypothetical protein SAMN05660206_10146 [Sphingobacterium wenxiniae]|uniref:Uncharacterized protein n=1 Tax=Sphingobacterium wenxiniae TaxID=683125 RepID=A0A1I6NS19_9SPHI|nr:hypothetical protein SAMN05660206_10146 [Sphingobacterium wenxiniae]